MGMGLLIEALQEVGFAIAFILFFLTAGTFMAVALLLWFKFVLAPIIVFTGLLTL